MVTPTTKATTDLDLLDLAIGLYDGESRSGQQCPFCKGGQSYEKSFSITREAHVVRYRCYRASCGANGRFNTRSGMAMERKTELGGKTREFEVLPAPLDDVTVRYLQDRYSLSTVEIRRAELGLTRRYSAGTDSRIYVPTFRPNGTTRGYLARDILGTQSPKALTFLFRTDEPNMGWYRNKRSKKLVIVEDAFSAIRASEYMNATYLLGTDLSKGKVDEIRRESFDVVYLALDKDATRKAIKQALEWRSYLDLKVIELDKDLKDLSRRNLTTFMENL